MHTEYSNNRQYLTKSDTSPKKRKVRNCYKRDTNTGKYLTFNEVYIRITRKRNTKGDCKVQTLALEIITPLNECTGRLSRVSTRHKHNRRGMQKKSKRKVQGVPKSQTAALPIPQEEEKTDKSKQAQTEQTYEKY